MRTLCGVLSLTCVLWAQSLPAPTSEELTTYRYYIRLFQNIKQIDTAQARSAANSKDTTGWARLLMEESGISPEEDSIIRPIAINAMSALSANQKARAEFQKNMKAQYSDPRQAPVVMQHQLADFWRRDFQIVNEHVSQIKKGLGDSRFQKFDSYVQKKYPLQPLASKP